MPLSSRWTSEHTADLPAELRAPTRLALLTSLAPHQVTDADVAAARPVLATDAALVDALAWAAFTAVRRISKWVGRDADGQTHQGIERLTTGDLPARATPHDGNNPVLRCSMTGWHEVAQVTRMSFRR